ncbi:MAG: IDEAL domain-containing protein [Alicyclobacillus sp.]|nr:IDEAL domain-containing protein [Alicyclobacillus sp.]
MVLPLLRALLIDYALDHRNRELFMRLTSADWEQYVVSATDEPTACAAVFVLHDQATHHVVQLQLPDSPLPTVFAVPEADMDRYGWRDVYGLTFYDRLRSAGYRVTGDWRRVSPQQWDDLRTRCRVVHPQDLAISHPSKTLRVQPAPYRRFPQSLA